MKLSLGEPIVLGLILLMNPCAQEHLSISARQLKV